MFHFPAGFTTKFWQKVVAVVSSTYYLLQEDGFAILQETGDHILLEEAP